jgi:Cdc25 family phosphatase
MVIIDVREKEERERYGSIPQSVHVLSELFEDDDGIEAIDEHAKGKTTVVFHCQYSQQRGPFCAQRYCAALSARDASTRRIPSVEANLNSLFFRRTETGEKTSCKS